MWNWLTQLVPAVLATRKSAPKTRRRVRRPGPLALEWLEAREVPAVAVQIDYSFDTSGFFNDPTRRAILQQAATDLGSRLGGSLAGINPGGTNTWTTTFFNPATGQQTTIANPTVGANTITVYAGGRDMTGGEAGVGGNGGYSASGSQGWLDSLRNRGQSGYSIWGGSVAFDTTGTNWFFGSSAAGLGANQVDFYSVAVHEVGHLLGIGTATSWFNQVSGGTYRGASADAVYGGAVPVSGDSAHWANGLTIGGQQAAMDPILPTGVRVAFTSLDFAALRDVGWSVDGTPSGGSSGGATSPPPSGTFPAPGPTPPPIAPPPIGAPGSKPVVLTGPSDGSAQAFLLNSNGTLSATGASMIAFPGWTGVVRSTVADFNGDGVQDFAFVTGPGTAATLRIVDGKSGADLVRPTVVLGGFTGGAYLAAGDVDRDGKAELALSADAGGGTRVSLLRVANGGVTTLADFLAFDDPTFRGGSRVAMGDVNRDGAADLIVGAGLGGGPRVAVYDGNALLAGQHNRLIPDFFALDPNLRSGVFVTSADLDGDGYADVIYSTGDTGGPRVRIVGGAVLSANPGQNAYFLPAMADFFVLDPADRKGLRVGARDLDGDGKAELIVGSGNKDQDTVRVIPFAQIGNPITSLQDPFASTTTVDGVYVG